MITAEKQLINQVAGSNEDFEWYPTPDEVIEAMVRDYLAREGYAFELKILDIGAGNGRVLNKFAELFVNSEGGKNCRVKKYAIEKSLKLVESMADDIFVIGTDFYAQSLLDKKMDIIFCNPPYSEYELWVKKILIEANAKYVYLLIPERWRGKDELIILANERGLSFESVMRYDFELSDLRKARAKTELVKFKIARSAKDPFKMWFESNFKIKADKKEYFSQYEAEREKKAEIKGAIVEKKSMINTLEELYNRDMEQLIATYKKLEGIDAEIFEEMEINWGTVLEKFRLKIEGLKNLYWDILFDNLDAITNRLTKKYRDLVFEQLTQHTEIDFTASNAYAIVLWIIKNANKYFDKQLLDVFDRLINFDTVKFYKSNKRFETGEWRYNSEKPTHCYLDYRFVHKGWSNFSSYYYDTVNGLLKSSADFIDDIVTIGRNLGFDVVDRCQSFQWEPGKENTFYYYNPISDTYERFMSVRCFKNGNIHFKLNKVFIRRLNVEAGRLKGWLKSPMDAVREMDDISEVDARKAFGCNFMFSGDVKQLPFLGDMEQE